MFGYIFGGFLVLVLVAVFVAGFMKAPELCDRCGELHDDGEDHVCKKTYERVDEGAPNGKA